MSVEKWMVSTDQNAESFVRLANALRVLGYKLGSNWSAVAGSQDISHWEASNDYGTLSIESETYSGLMVSGSADLVLKLRQAFEAAPLSTRSLDPTMTKS